MVMHTGAGGGRSNRWLRPLIGIADFPIAVLVPAGCRLPPGPVALALQAALTGDLALGWVGDGVVVVRVVRPPAPRLNGLLGRLSRNETVAAVPDQIILVSGLDERLPHGKPVLRLEELHQRSLMLAVAHLLRHRHRLAGHRVHARELPHVWWTPR